MPITTAGFDRELKKGSAELLILSLLQGRARHGYEISQLIEQRSDGTLKFNVASLYPLLYRLEKPGQRRRRYYRLIPAGKAMLKQQRRTWAEFVAAMQRITGVSHA
jgi:PadR family transcriptional regulator, regulatory protein PadR